MRTAEMTAVINIAPKPSPSVALRASSKIGEEHWKKLAIVYVRQSSPQQVVENRESRARQYALADLAKALGWPAERVLVIDEDQGQSGTRADNRSGFQRVLTEVTLDHVGIVLALQMSRLARSSKDWHHLLEVGTIFGVLLADQDGVYDPSDPNDRLLLGLKGTMSEVELHTMRNRLDRGRLNKAQRGELFYGVPLGYVILPHGEVAFDPDEQARCVTHLLFEKFDEIGSLYGLMGYLVRNDIRLPIRVHAGPNQGKLEWHRANQHAAFYGCDKHLLQARERTCYGLRSRELDELLRQQVVKALQPAALELSMKALEDAEKERARLHQHWQQQFKRVRYDVDLAERRYQAVDPANRLVASSLEKRWEESLNQQRQLQEDYDRFLRESPPRLSAQERAAIEALATNIPALWQGLATTNAHRKQIVRLLRTPIQKYWVLWADRQEVKRLKALLAMSRRGINAYNSDLTTAKARTQTAKKR